MKSVSFAILRAEKAQVFQESQPLREEDSLVADDAVLRLPRIILPVPVPGKNEQSIEQILPCSKNVSTCITCASSMSCQSCQLMGHSCSNPVHIKHHYQREGTLAGVKE